MKWAGFSSVSQCLYLAIWCLALSQKQTSKYLRAFEETFRHKRRDSNFTQKNKRKLTHARAHTHTFRHEVKTSKEAK